MNKTFAFFLFWLLCLPTTPSSAALRIGRKAPPLILRSVSGSAYLDLHDWVGKRPRHGASYVVVSFYATWCSPCIKERKSLVRLRRWVQKKRWAVRFLVVATGRGQTEDVLHNSISRRAFGLPLVVDSYQRVAVKWRVYRLPTTYILAPNGRILARFRGFNADIKARLKNTLLRLLKSAPKASKTILLPKAQGKLRSLWKPSLAVLGGSASLRKRLRKKLQKSYLWLPQREQKRLLKRHRWLRRCRLWKKRCRYKWGRWLGVRHLLWLRFRRKNRRVSLLWTSVFLRKEGRKRLVRKRGERQQEWEHRIAKQVTKGKPLR